MVELVFVKGILLGFSIAAPVGPIGILCIKRTIAGGLPNGLASGLGAATADAFYGGVAAFGLTLISNYLLEHSVFLREIGGLFLCYLGYKSFISQPFASRGEAKSGNILYSYLTTVLLTISNPMTIISFGAVFLSMGVGYADYNQGLAASMVIGVFIGSCLWWLLLGSAVSIFRNRINDIQLHWINRCSGIILVGFGLISLCGLVH